MGLREDAEMLVGQIESRSDSLQHNNILFNIYEGECYILYLFLML